MSIDNLENIKSRNKVNILEKIKLKTKEILFKSEIASRLSTPNKSISVPGYLVGVKVFEENDEVYLKYEKLWRNSFFQDIEKGNLDKKYPHQYIIFRKELMDESFYKMKKAQAEKFLPKLFNLKEANIKAKEEDKDLLELLASLPYTIQTPSYVLGSNCYAGDHYHVIPTPKQSYMDCQDIRKTVFIEKCGAEIVDEKEKLCILDRMDKVRKNFKNKSDTPKRKNLKN